MQSAASKVSTPPKAGAPATYSMVNGWGGAYGAISLAPAAGQHRGAQRAKCGLRHVQGWAARHVVRPLRVALQRQATHCPEGTIQQRLQTAALRAKQG